MKTLVEFGSDRFPAYDGEDEQINPGIFGKRLTGFISALDKILSDEVGIREKKWWTHEEFDRPQV
jgi:hypothetical protein